MAFPDDEDLPLILEAAYGADPDGDPGDWDFTDISTRLVRTSDIRIRTGRAPGALTTDAGACSVVLDNDDGDWTPLNPRSTVYPFVRLGLPMRLRYRLAADAFGRTVASGWGSTDDGYDWTAFGAGGTVALSNFNVAAGVGTHLVPVANGNRATYLADVAVPDVEVLVTVSLAFTDVTGGNVEPANILLRGTSISSFYTARVEITTAEAVQVKLFDPASNLLASATVSGLTHTSAQALRVKAQIVGNFFAIKVWAAAGSEPTGWHASAVDDAVPVAGWIGISSGLASGNSNAPVTFSYDDLVVTVGQFSGFTASLQPDFIPTTSGDPLSVTRVTLGGRLRSLSQNAKPARSAMHRTMSGIAPGDFVPIAYWPMEDGGESAQFASATPGVAAMTLGGDIELSNSDAIVGSQPLPIWQAGSNATGHVPDYTDTGVWTAQALVLPPADLVVQNQAVTVFRAVMSGGTYSSVSVGITPGSQLALVTRDAGGNIVDTWTDTFPTGSVLGLPVSVAVQAVDDASGSDDGWSASLIGADGTVLASISELSGAGHYGRITDILPNGLLALATDVVIGHAGVWTDPAFTLGVDDLANAQSMGGWDGELPTDRLARLGREEGVAIDIVAGGSTQPMGPQPVGTFLELAQACAAVDGGFLGEQVDGFGLSYVPLAARVNRAADMTIDLATYRVTSGDSPTVLAPTYDDQGIANEVTASRPDGSSATVADQTHIAAHGRYEAAITRNVQTDAQLPDQAGWEVNLRTVDAMRYPNTPANIHANITTLLMPWLGMRPGLSRVVRTNLPSKAGTADDDRMLDGYTATLQPRRWTGSYEGSPSAPLQVAVYDGSARYGASATVLAEDLTDVETSALVDPVGETWVTTASHASRFPFDVTIGGLDYSCTAIQSSVRDTFGGSSSSGWGTTDSGQAWSVGAGTPSLFSETSGVGRIAVSTLNAEHYIAVDVGYAPRQRVRVYQTLSVTPTGAAINWGTLLRYSNASNTWWIDVQVGTSGSLTLRAISKVSAANVQRATAVSATVHSTSVARILVAEIDENDVIRAKVYADGAAEPGWELVYDASVLAILQTGTAVGCIARLMSSNTNSTPVQFDFDNFEVLSPYEFTLVRLADDKTHAAGEPVTVTDTGRYGL